MTAPQNDKATIEKWLADNHPSPTPVERALIEAFRAQLTDGITIAEAQKILRGMAVTAMSIDGNLDRPSLIIRP